MTNLAHAIRAVRQRLDKTMVEFAEMIGCRQSTVSRYESGKLVPGRSVLILLLQLAQGAERGPILDVLGVSRAVATGWPERDLIGALKTFEEYLDLSSAAPRARDRGREASLAAFARIAKRVILEGSPVEPALVGILDRWIAHGADPAARRVFRQLAAYLDVELTVLGRPTRGRRQRSTSRHRPRTHSAT